MCLNVNGKDIELDEDGFLINPGDWNEDVAKAFAKIEGIGLTEDHYKVINYLRGYYMKNQMVPIIRNICKQTGFSLKYIYELFPSGPAKGACKLAGLPKPAGCV